MKSIYIAGPMSGIAQFNFPAFFAAQRMLEAEGWKVWNPAAKDDEEAVTKDASFATGDAALLLSSGWDFKRVFKWDTSKVIESDAIYMLKGWENSPGATAEHAVAVVMRHKYPDYRIIYEQ